MQGMQPLSPGATPPGSTPPHPHPTGYVYGAVCRVNFWVKMTTALGITQIVIGVSCVVFYSVAFFTDRSTDNVVRYLTVGLVTGAVIAAAGVLGMLCCKRKTKCTITSFLILSILAAMFALFPMVLGIVGATSSVLGEESLLMPICQLVFSTVEIVVATWSIGVCCQAICCPNATFGHVSTRMPSGVGITQFISSGDGQHVVLFTSSPTSPSTLMYNMNGAPQPYIIQQGVPTLQVTTQPGIMCAVGQHSLTPPPNYYDTPQGAASAGGAATVAGVGSTDHKMALDDDVGVAEETKLLDEAGQTLTTDELTTDRDTTPVTAGDGLYEVDDEQAHLLC